MDHIGNKVKEILSQTLGVDKGIITDSLSIGDIPQWDSMGNIAIISAVEEAFGVEIPMDDLFELTSVKGITDWLEANL